MPTVFVMRKMTKTYAVCDHFERTGEAPFNFLDAFTSGLASGWTAVDYSGAAGPVWGSVSGQLKPTSGGGFLTRDIGAPDFDLTVTVNNLAFENSSGIVFRYIDVNNYYFWDRQDIYKIVAGVGTRVSDGTQAAGGANTWNAGDVLRLVATGNRIDFYRNGDHATGYIIATDHLTATKVGFRGDDFRTVTWDDLRVTSTLGYPWANQSGAFGITSGKAVVGDVTGGTPPFGLTNRAFARYPVGAGSLDLSVDWASSGTNLLYANQSNFDSGVITGWTADLNCTLAADTAQAVSGAYSMKVTYTGPSNGGLTASTPGGTAGFPVVPGQTYAASARVRTSYTNNNIQINYRWYNAAGTLIQTDNNSYLPASGTAWTDQVWERNVAPAGAAFAALVLNLLNVPSVPYLVYLDDVGFYQTTSSSPIFASSISNNSVVFAYDPTTDSGLSLDYNGRTTISLVRHIGSTATTLATATVAAFTSATFEIVYDETAGTIVVTKGGATIISVSTGDSFTDAFTRADSTTSPGPGWSVMRLSNGATGHTLVNSPVAGVNTNQGYVVSFTTDTTAGQALQTVAYRDIGGRDCDITWTVGVSGQIGAMARVPADGTSAIWVDPSTGSISDPLSGTSYGSYSPAGAGVVMRLVCLGDTCRLYRAGVNVVTFTHTGTGTRHGWGGITSGRVDDVTVALASPTGGWAGLMSDAANADQWDEFCWTVS